MATYGEAEFYCESKTLGGGELLSLENNEQVEILHQLFLKLDILQNVEFRISWLVSWMA